MKNVGKIVKAFEENQLKQEEKNYSYALNGLEKGTITFSVDEDNNTIIKFNNCDEELYLDFEDYKFLRTINPSLLWYCHNEQPIPLSEIEILSLKEQAQLITKCIEECDCMCNYEYYSNILATC